MIKGELVRKDSDGVGGGSKETEARKGDSGREPPNLDPQ